MAENRRDKDKRWFFTRGQMVLLGGAFTLASVIIFFLGMIASHRRLKGPRPAPKPKKRSRSTIR